MSDYAFKFSPSLLQGFQDYLDCEANYEKFFGNSEEPSLTYAEYEEQKFKELIDKINRVPFESEAASRGSCLNEIVDCIVMRTRSTRDDIKVKTLSSFEKLCEEGAWDYVENKPLYYERWFETIKQPCIWAKNGDYEFYFDISFCKRLAEYFRDSLCQIYTEAPIATKYGKVLLYGYPDYVRENMVYDLKTTSKYEFGKYGKYWQRLVYPYTLIESGKVTDVKAFEFTAFAMKGGTSRSPLIYGDMYPEVYDYDHTKATEAIRGICTQFAEFLLNNRNLITDKKVFGGEKEDLNAKVELIKKTFNAEEIKK